MVRTLPQHHQQQPNALALPTTRRFNKFFFWQDVVASLQFSLQARLRLELFWAVSEALAGHLSLLRTSVAAS